MYNGLLVAEAFASLGLFNELKGVRGFGGQTEPETLLSDPPERTSHVIRFSEAALRWRDVWWRCSVGRSGARVEAGNGNMRTYCCSWQNFTNCFSLNDTKKDGIWTSWTDIWGNVFFVFGYLGFYRIWRSSFSKYYDFILVFYNFLIELRYNTLHIV